MATNAKQAPVRADSAVNGITSLSDSLSTAQNLQAAIVSFASGDGFHMLSQLIDTIPQLEKKIGEKDDRINKLTAQFATEKENHSAFNQKQLANYSAAYDTWKREEVMLKQRVEKLQNNLQEKDTEITKLQSEREDLKGKGRDISTKSMAKTTKLKEKEQEIIQLRQQQQKAQANADDYSEKFSKSQSRASNLDASLQKNEIEYNKLKTESSVTKERLREVLKFAAPLEDLNLGNIADELESLWKSATSLIRKFFRKDLPNTMLQSDWSELRENAIFKHQIPLPQSNSDIAKEMRVAIVLGILVRLVDTYIFQPTYLLTEDSGFRELLYRQATVDPRKEMFTRGIILSMYPEEQESNGKERIYWVIEDLLRKAGVRALVPHEATVLFAEELETFLTQIQGSWRSVLYGKQKLEPSFRYSHDDDLYWHNFEVQAANGKEGDKSILAVTSDALEDDSFVIFPRIYLMGSEPIPITSGTVLWKAQLRPAAQELRSTTSHTLFEQTGLTRHRSRPSRTMSMGGDGARGGPSEKRFLSKPPVS